MNDYRKLKEINAILKQETTDKKITTATNKLKEAISELYFENEIEEYEIIEMVKIELGNFHLPF